MSRSKIRVIILNESTQWVAQGLEHDICVQAASLEELHGRFQVTLRLESEETGGLDRIPPAPQHFHDLWNKKSGDFVPTKGDADSFEFGMAA